MRNRIKAEGLRLKKNIFLKDYYFTSILRRPYAAFS